jgi:hypothetical protein
VAGDADDAPATAASSAASAPFSPETGSADSSVIVPPAEAPEGQRLPVFEAVESDWFRRVHKGFGLSATAAETNGDWASPADDGWRAAETVASPSSSGVTEAGLPKRIPQANLVPGAVGSAQTAEASPKPAGSARSPASTRERLASFQRGVAEGRAAASPGGDPGEEDGSS